MTKETTVKRVYQLEILYITLNLTFHSTIDAFHLKSPVQVNSIFDTCLSEKKCKEI